MLYTAFFSRTPVAKVSLVVKSLSKEQRSKFYLQGEELQSPMNKSSEHEEEWRIGINVNFAIVKFLSLYI